MIDSDEELSDNLECLIDKFRKDQQKQDEEEINKVINAAYKINKRSRQDFESEIFVEQQIIDRVKRMQESMRRLQDLENKRYEQNSMKTGVDKCSGKKTFNSMDSDQERDRIEQQMRKSRAELKRQMANQRIRKKINENILVDSRIMKMIRQLKKSKLLKKLKQRNKIPKKTPRKKLRKSMTPSRR